MMKRTILLTIAMVLLLSLGLQVFALEIPGYEGGIKNERVYQEVIFITGKPILLTGTLTSKRTERNNKVTETYTYRLENAAEQAKLTRTVKLSVDVNKDGDQSQETYTLDNYTESIEVAGIKYALDKNSAQWSKSKAMQNKPGVTYFAGNWNGRKVYSVNNNQGEVTIETLGEVVGYQQYWGDTETQILTHYIDYRGNGDNPVTWQGTVKVEAVHNRTTGYSYEPNSPTQISFRGGYLLTEQSENILKYTYDLPRNPGSNSKLRLQGTESLSLNTNPVIKRLMIPEMRDVIGTWAEKEILLLASLEAVYPDNTYFGPSLPMSRADFARALAVVMGLVEEEVPTTTSSRRKSIQPQEELRLFLDVSNQDPNMKYIKAVYEKGIMQGDGKGSFMANQTITKAEAATIIIRLLGFENLAPLQNYSTGFRDDGEIPVWAKDAVYVARELNLVNGVTEGNATYFQPQKALTKAEGAAMLTNLIKYLQEDIRYDYRERILNY